MQSFPDPALTANLYCAGGLDEAFFRVVGADPERAVS